jgi:hypothetical protein
LEIVSHCFFFSILFEGAVVVGALVVGVGGLVSGVRWGWDWGEGGLRTVYTDNVAMRLPPRL